MEWVAIIVTALIVLWNRKKGWTSPTKKDKDWADSHEDLIRRNS